MRRPDLKGAALAAGLFASGAQSLSREAPPPPPKSPPAETQSAKAKKDIGAKKAPKKPAEGVWPAEKGPLAGYHETLRTLHQNINSFALPGSADQKIHARDLKYLIRQVYKAGLADGVSETEIHNELRGFLVPLRYNHANETADFIEHHGYEK